MKIVLVAPNEEWKRIFDEVLPIHNADLSSLYNDEIFELETVYRDDYIHFDDFSVDCDAVIARGVAATNLRRRLEIPVVQIPMSVFTIERAAREAIGRYHPKKIAAIGFNFSMIEVDSLTCVEGVPINAYALSDSQTSDVEKELEKLILQGKDDGCDAFLCGVYGVKICEKYGLAATFTDINRQEAWFALTEAKHNAYVYSQQRLRAELYKNVLDYSFEGIVSLDENMNIKTHNNAAARMLTGEKGQEQNIVEKIKKDLDDSGIRKIAEDHKKHTDDVVAYKDRYYSVSVVPLIVKNENRGSVVFLQDVTRIQKLESQIRHKIYSHGHIARYRFEDIAGTSRELQNVIELAREYSAADSNILICGETGTGKEVFAQSIHNLSSRSKGPFVAVNCAALSESLLESELFGYVEGAFTGAAKGGKLGYFELAHNGTIFLDEISEIPIRLQGKLLRVLEEKEIIRLGDDKVTPVNVRILCATNKDLEALVAAGNFREDLFYRLDVLQIDLPPLGNRIEDIPTLSELFFREYAGKNKKNLTIDAAAYRELQKVTWKGNIRQLRNVCERLVVVCKSGVVTDHDVRRVLLLRPEPPSLDARNGARRLKTVGTSESLERTRIFEALDTADGDREETAKLLRISRATLYRKLKKYKIG